MQAALSLYSGSGKYAETVVEVWDTTKQNKASMSIQHSWVKAPVEKGKKLTFLEWRPPLSAGRIKRYLVCCWRRWIVSRETDSVRVNQLIAKSVPHYHIQCVRWTSANPPHTGTINRNALFTIIIIYRHAQSTQRQHQLISVILQLDYLWTFFFIRSSLMYLQKAETSRSELTACPVASKRSHSTSSRMRTLQLSG